MWLDYECNNKILMIRFDNSVDAGDSRCQFWDKLGSQSISYIQKACAVTYAGLYCNIPLLLV